MIAFTKAPPGSDNTTAITAEKAGSAKYFADRGSFPVSPESLIARKMNAAVQLNSDTQKTCGVVL